MDRLPDELVLMVLECLPVRDRLQAARVCRRWRALALRRALHIQHHIDARAAAARHTALLVTARCCDLPAALSRTPYLSELTVHARVPLSATACTALYHLPHLQHLDVFSRERIIAPTLIPVALRLSSFVINETVPPGVLKALSHSRRLRSLHMYGRALYFPRRELTPLLTARRDHLRELTLRCAELPDSAYEVIGECHGLVTLRLYSCWLLTGAGAAHLTRPVSLRELHITGARMLRPTPLKEFLRALPLRLEELVLSAGWFGDEHISSLTTRVPGLRVLELWRCYLSARGVCELAAALPRLWELDIDTVLHAAELRLLAVHPTLSRLRCVPGEEATRASVTSACWSLTPATARYGRGCLRGGGEGWRSELLHHWSGPLRPLPPHAPPPAFDDDDEDDYSLLDLAPG